LIEQIDWIKSKLKELEINHPYDNTDAEGLQKLQKANLTSISTQQETMYENREEIINRQQINKSKKNKKKNKIKNETIEGYNVIQEKKTMPESSKEGSPQGINSSRIAVHDSEGESHTSSTKVDCPKDMTY
jgi:hypothetical protein